MEAKGLSVVYILSSGATLYDGSMVAWKTHDTVGIKTVALNFCNFLCYNDVDKRHRRPCVWKNGRTGLSVERLVWMRLCHFFQRLEGVSGSGRVVFFLSHQ